VLQDQVLPAFFYQQFFDAAMRAKAYHLLHHIPGVAGIRPALSGPLLNN
jgi:hypothetical protein